MNEDFHIFEVAKAKLTEPQRHEFRKASDRLFWRGVLTGVVLLALLLFGDVVVQFL